MRRFCLVSLLCLMPAPVLAGAQYTAEDVIRYFEQANATTVSPEGSITRTAPVSTRGIVIGEPAAPGPQGVVIGNAPPPAPAAASPAGDPPMAIPMTGAKAGHAVSPAEAEAVATAVPTVAPSGAAAPAPAPDGYDMLVTFELDSATLTPQARQNLDAFARALASPALSGLRFAVEGHTDATGSGEHNMALSERRAASVVSYLVEHGVAPDRLIAKGYGETRPRRDDPEHPDNRRVETHTLN